VSKSPKRRSATRATTTSTRTSCIRRSSRTSQNSRRASAT
jgi:hypothetical protein